VPDINVELVYYILKLRKPISIHTAPIVIRAEPAFYHDDL
jgi:hypothetical protein